MDKKSALSSIFQDTLIGLLIGWGGFSAVLPNFMEAMGEITNLGSYKALRIFSIVYFLSPIFVFLIYWWVRGFKRYYYAIVGSLPSSINYFNTWLVISIAYKLPPLICFFYDQFFIYKTTVLGYEIFGYQNIIFCYALGAAAELYFLTKNIGRNDEQVFSAQKKMILFKVNTIILSLIVLLGVGISVFIEPWAIYDNNFMFIIIAGFSIYLFCCGLIYMFLITKEGRSIQEYKDWGLGLMIIVLLAGSFPALNYKWLAGGWLILLVTVMLISWVIFSNIRNGEKWYEYKTVWIGFISMALVSFFIIFGFIDKVYLKSNQLYFTNRVIAAKNISSKKIFPFFIYDDKGGFDETLFLKGSKIAEMKNVFKNNHIWADSCKIDPVFWKNKKPLAGKNALSIQEKYNIRNVFYKTYIPYTKDQDKDPEHFRQYVKSNIGCWDSLQVFYSSTYKHIHDDLLDKYLKHDYISNLSESDIRVENYFHPINYYTETLKYYKKRTDHTRNLQGYIREYKFLDTLKINTQHKNLINKNTIDHNEALDNKKASLFSEKILPFLKEFPELSLLANESFTSYFINYLDFFKTYTDLQYYQRYKKAQIIFRTYLLDTQRIGVFILIYLMVILGLLYWYHSELPGDFENGEDIPYDTPQHFLKISILVAAVMFIHIALPIKSENIDPEKPYWMMDLNSWNSPNALRNFIYNKPSPPKPSLGDGSQQLVDLMDQVESNLQTLIKVNQSNINYNKTEYENLK